MLAADCGPDGRGGVSARVRSLAPTGKAATARGGLLPFVGQVCPRTRARSEPILSARRLMGSG